MIRKKQPEPKRELTVEQQIRRRNFISFAAFIGLNAAAYGGWKWLRNSPKEPLSTTGRAQMPLRGALNKTELAFRKLFSRNHLVKTYDRSRAAKAVRQNGKIGLKREIDLADWKLQVKRSSAPSFSIDLNELKMLPKTELVFDFKCIEGWDQIQHWAGVRLIDFMEHYDLRQEAAMEYLGMETPDKGYYVGIDMESARHPQTILAYEMNDHPLTQMHGAPLRLIIPVKYGIKNLKRVGTITFSNQRPPDFWAEQGYDYYSGL